MNQNSGTSALVSVFSSVLILNMRHDQVRKAVEFHDIDVYTCNRNKQF